MIKCDYCRTFQNKETCSNCGAPIDINKLINTRLDEYVSYALPYRLGEYIDQRKNSKYYNNYPLVPSGPIVNSDSIVYNSY